MPPVTSSALTPTLPISIKENELINPKTVPSNPKSGAIEIVVAKKLLNFSNSYCKDCIDIDNAIERFFDYLNQNPLFWIIIFYKDYY